MKYYKNDGKILKRKTHTTTITTSYKRTKVNLTIRKKYLIIIQTPTLKDIQLNSYKMRKKNMIKNIIR